MTLQYSCFVEKPVDVITRIILRKSLRAIDGRDRLGISWNARDFNCPENIEKQLAENSGRHTRCLGQFIQFPDFLHCP